MIISKIIIKNINIFFAAIIIIFCNFIKVNFLITFHIFIKVFLFLFLEYFNFTQLVKKAILYLIFRTLYNASIILRFIQIILTINLPLTNRINILFFAIISVNIHF
jgi:hypothetical protein